MNGATDFKQGTTVGEKYGPAMEISDQAAADEYFERCVRHAMEVGGLGRTEAERVERINLGYYAGYYGEKTRERVERLFQCSHPIFGSIAERGSPTPEEAFEMGKRRGEELRRAALPGPGRDG